jgi:transcriptional regulator with XRE-family HTH domain
LTPPEQHLLILESFTPGAHGCQLRSHFLDLAPQVLDHGRRLPVYGHQRHHPPQPRPRQNRHEHRACARTRSLVSSSTEITPGRPATRRLEGVPHGTVRGVGNASADAMITSPEGTGRYDMAELHATDEGTPNAPEGPPGPFTELLARTIAEQSLSLAQVARRVDQEAAKDNVKLATTKQQVYRWRRGPQIPGPQMVRWLAGALDRPLEEFADAAHRQRQVLKARPEPGQSPPAFRAAGGVAGPFRRWRPPAHRGHRRPSRR